MRGYQTIICASALLLTATYSVAATNSEILQIPQCLAKHLNYSQQTLAENRSFKIVKIPSTDVRNLSTLAEQIHCGRFMNITHKFNAQKDLAKQAHEILQKKPLAITLAATPVYKINHKPEVLQALALVEPGNISQTLTRLTTFTNRSSTQKTGVQTASWLKAQFESMATEYGRTDTQTFFVATGGRYLQPSLVTVIGKDIHKPALVIGAHMDTLGDSVKERMPGADDDGSGSASVLEMTRVLLASNVKLNRPVYIVWYAAEEEGLVGSQKVVSYFKKHSIPVYAALQLDMTGYRSNENDKTMWVFRDYTDNALNNFVTQLIQTYVKVPVKFSQCGYGCSDHASWNEQGIPASFPCETSFEDHNPYIHSASDTMNVINLEHMTNFTKLAVAFTIELAL